MICSHCSVKLPDLCPACKAELLIYRHKNRVLGECLKCNQTYAHKNCSLEAVRDKLPVWSVT